jgi:RHS repeat-associated protein
LKDTLGSYRYYYDLTDHLGNVRAVIREHPSLSDSLQVIQRDNYYPFGLTEFAGAKFSKYLYNSKELQVELGQYDYGARLYDPVIGRWNVGDVMAEKYYSSSPYNYVDNNPINRIDPDGRSWYTRYVDEQGRTLLNTDDGRDDVVVVPQGRFDEFNENVRWNQRMLNTFGWNDHWREEFGIAVTESELYQFGYHGLSSEKSKEASIEHLFGSRTFQSFVWEEVKAQWGNPQLVASGLLTSAHGGLATLRAKGLPKSSPKFRTPSNPPQVPPTVAPAGHTLRVMPPTQQYPHGYWIIEKPMPHGGAQGINPATMKPGARYETHVPLPPGYWK